MLPEKFRELEEKIRLTAELVARLRQEKQQLERQQEDAAKRIAELEAEVARLRAERHPPGAATEPPLRPLGSRQSEPPDPALRRLHELLGREPNNVAALFELGNLYERQGLYEQAIHEYRKVLNIDPDFVDAIEHLAFLLEKLNRDHEASPLWERILSLKKRD
jgi:tetratricopeptide (TPR) repeat protein